MSTNLPYYSMYPKDFDSNEAVRVMSFCEKGLYVVLLNHAWINNGLPDDPAKIQRLAGAGAEEFATMWPAVEPCFPIAADGRRRNVRQEKERAVAKKKVDRIKKAQAAKEELKENVVNEVVNERENVGHVSGAASDSPSSASIDTSSEETATTRARGDEQLDLSGDLAKFIENSSRRALSSRIKTNTKVASRTVERLRELERDFGRSQFRRGWLAFLAKLPDLDVREPLAYFAACASRWIPDEAPPSAPTPAPNPQPEQPEAATAEIIPIRSPLTDPKFQAFIRIAAEHGNRTVTKQEAEAAWDNRGTPVLEQFCWVRITDHQRDRAILHYRQYCEQRKTEPKFIKSPLNFLKTEPWAAYIVEVPVKTLSDKTQRGLDIVKRQIAEQQAARRHA